MTGSVDALSFDRQALALIRADIASITDTEMTLPTPCDGWTVADLLTHMNRENAAICGEGQDAGADPRNRFPSTVDRWLAFFSRAGDSVRVPKLAADLPSQSVLATHAVDMLIHRWDLARARGRTLDTPATMLPYAHSVADLVTADGSPLTGPDGVYKPALPVVAEDESFDALVRKYGRDPTWAAR